MCLAFIALMDSGTSESKSKVQPFNFEVSYLEEAFPESPYIGYVDKPYSTSLFLWACSFSEKYSIPLDFLYSVIEAESEFSKDVNSRAGAVYGRGLMQVSEIALKEYNNWHTKNYTIKDLYTIGTNLEIGCWYLTYCYSKVKVPNKDWRDAYCAYNVGPAHFNKYYKSLYSGWNYNNRTKTWEKYGALKRLDRKCERIAKL